MKVILIGIDGLDYELLSKFKDDLPNFTKLMETSNVRMSSVFPPDSPTAWTSIYTGKNPAEHGVVSFKDPFRSTKHGEYLGNNVSGKTFWDKAGAAGKKVCILFPHMGYPVWPVNGVMVGRTTEVDIKKFDIQAHPPELISGLDHELLKPMTSYPLDLGDMIKPTKELILNEIAFAMKLFKDFDWDLYFYYSSALDNIEHLFWMYYDENDPYYDANNPYRNVIPDFYRFYDENVIGKFLEMKDEETVLMVLSDHGHAMRPPNVININEVLRRRDLLRAKSESSRAFTKDLFTSIKKVVLSTIDNHRLVGKLASKILKIFPAAINLYLKSTPIDQDVTLAYLSDPSGGIKAYSYAGIKINRDIVDNDNYEGLCEDIIRILLSLKDPKTQQNITEWAVRREELYKGGNLHKYPDVLFKLKDYWGVGWDVNESLYSKSRSHKLHSGNHRADTAVFLCSDPSLNLKKEMTLMDVCPTIMRVLGVQK